ncbi:MAG TPA: NBR1-Ig-like domain-containing protein [Anaerolineales bacterium]
MPKTAYLLGTLLCIGALLAGCNLPFFVEGNPVSVQTAAALTVQAQLTAVAPATATFTLVPFPTLPQVTNTAPPVNTLPPAPTLTPNCDRADFVADVTVPDNTVINAGASFSKTWRLKNSGVCSWTPSYAVVFANGASMGGPAVQALAGNVNPGQTVDITVNLTAPGTDGNYTGNWALRNAAGVIFSHFYVQIVVNSGTGGPFAVTHVGFAVSTFNETGYTGCPMVTAHIQTNGTGDVQYHWTRSDGSSGAVQTLHFSAAGSQDVQDKWYLGSAATGTHWMGIYIDSPNHQDFGHQDVNNCTSP